LGQTTRRIFKGEESKKKAGSNQPTNQPTKELTELEFKTTFRKNGYSLKQMRRALNPAVRTSKQKDKPTSFALPTQQIAGQTHQECWHTAPEGLQLPPSGEGQRESKDCGGVQHTL